MDLAGGFTLSPLSQGILCLISLSSIYIAYKIVAPVVYRIIGLIAGLSRPSRRHSGRQGPGSHPASVLRTPELAHKQSGSKGAGGVPGSSLKSLKKRAGQAQGTHAPERVPESNLYCATLRGASSAISGISWSPEGDTLAVSTADQAVVVWQLAAGTDIAENCLPRRALPHTTYDLRRDVTDVAFIGGRGTVAVQTFDGAGQPALSLLALPSRPTGRTMPVAAWTRPLGRRGANSRPGLRLVACTASRGGSPLLACATKGTAVTVLTAAGEVLGTVDTGGFENYDVAMSADGRWVAAATFANDVKVFEVGFDRAGTFSGIHKVMALKGFAGRVLAVAFAPDLARAAAVSADGTVRTWSLNVRYSLQEDPKPLVSARLPRAPDTAHAVRLAWGPAGLLALTCGTDLALLDETTGACLAEVPDAHPTPIAAVAWAPCRLKARDRPVWALATAGSDGRVRLWEAPVRTPAMV